MTIRTYAASLAVVAALGMSGLKPAGAVELTVFLNQATESGVRELAKGFEQATGNKVNVVFKAGAELNKAITSGEPGDLTSGGAGLDEYVKTGKVVQVVDYARVANGAAVKEGGKKYDISTVAKLKDALLEAKTIGHSNAGTGPFNTRMFQKMGIYDQIKDKIRITMGGKLVAQALIDGDFEFGIQQTNVIQPFPGTIYLGPLPDELLEYATSSVGLLAVSKHPEEAKAFMKYMADPANAGLLRKGAMFPLS